MSPVATTSMNSLKDLLVEQLHELHSEESHSEAVLTRLAGAAASQDLADALRAHVTETRQHLARIDRVLGELGARARKIETHGAKGILEDCASIAGRTKVEPHVRDAAIIATVQRLEHDEMAGYGCARTWAQLLGHPNAAAELLKSLTEERRFDENLSRIAEKLNRSAVEPVASAR